MLKVSPCTTTNVGMMLAAGLVVEAMLATVEVLASKLVTPLELTRPLDNAPAFTLELAVGATSPDEEAWDAERVVIAEELAAGMTISSTSKV